MGAECAERVDIDLATRFDFGFELTQELGQAALLVLEALDRRLGAFTQRRAFAAVFPSLTADSHEGEGKCDIR